MIERAAGSTFQSLQGLQASQGFSAAQKSVSGFRDALAQETQTLQDSDDNNAAFQTASQPSSINTPSAVSLQNQLQPMIKEVSQIAQSTGFVGVTPQDVVRAYHSGQSFLADYKV